MGWTHRPKSKSSGLPRFVQIAIPVIVVAAIVGGVVLLTRPLIGGGGPQRFVNPADEWGCGVARPTVSPAPVSPGGELTIAAGSAHCAKSLPDGTTFDVSVGPADGSDALVSGQASVQHDGSFMLTLKIPSDFPLGEAQVLVDDSSFVPCDDTSSAPSGGMALVSCAASTARFEVVG